MNDKSKTALAPKTWKTKHGSRRVRHEEPTIAEAITAAQGLSDDRNEQVEIAASLMAGISRDAIRAELLKLAPASQRVIKPSAPVGRTAAQREVVVEHRRPRRMSSSQGH